MLLLQIGAHLPVCRELRFRIPNWKPLVVDVWVEPSARDMVQVEVWVVEWLLEVLVSGGEGGGRSA